ncbi:MAG TPA: heavy-metal-associated domain-containing protein [Gemmataceae bacterium]|jgi:copper chaperone CopZ
MSHVHLTIDGMHCDACVRRVTGALQSVPGVRVERVRVGAADVEYNPLQTPVEKIVAVLDEAGYPARAEGDL